MKKHAPYIIVYFNGQNIEQRVKSLGFSIMDDASGNYFGRQLIRDFYFNHMPENLRVSFSEKYNMDSDFIKYNLYKQPNPNAYLANFVEFILRNDRNVYFNKVLRKGMKEFFENRILSYPESKSLPVHFVGSIAYFAQDAIKDVARLNMIELGNIVRRPIDGLIEYHKEKLKLEKI